MALLALFPLVSLVILIKAGKEAFDAGYALTRTLTPILARNVALTLALALALNLTLNKAIVLNLSQSSSLTPLNLNCNLNPPPNPIFCAASTQIQPKSKPNPINQSLNLSPTYGHSPSSNR